jgi:hypothetical protein
MDDSMTDHNNKSFEERLEIYFEYAVQAWLLLKDEAGLVAALAAAKTFNSPDRQIIIDVLDNLTAQIEQQETDQIILNILKSIRDLKEIITARDWTVEDGVAERERLKMVNPEYAQALIEGDPGIFARKYPDFFQS